MRGFELWGRGRVGERWERRDAERRGRDKEETRKRQVDRWGERREERGRCREKRCAHLI